MAKDDFVITNLRGGVNNSDPPNAIPNDQVVEGMNVEWIASMLGERRLGADGISLVGSPLLGSDRVTFLHRHLPTADTSAAELWGVGITGTTAVIARKTTAWSTVTPIDAVTASGVYQYLIRAATFHGKLFLAFKSASDRLHVYDGTLRRTGLAEPAAAPTVSDTGSGGFSGTRYYRVRYTLQVAGVTELRSNPSDSRTFSPTGAGLAARITKPADITDTFTHWELEASVDNTNFYVIATLPKLTTTYDDSTPFSPGYADLFDLSPDIADYDLIPSARFLAVDDDRLVWASSFEDEALSSRVGWTPVGKADGVGNDERMEADTDPFLDLDALEGGGITDMVAGVHGYIYVFKKRHTYQLVRTGSRSRAYQAYILTKDRGAIEGSVVTALDATGNPTTYVLDPAVGPCLITKTGILSCGADIRATWETVNLDATKVVARGAYYPRKKQVHWWISTDDANSPNLHLVLHTQYMREAADGIRGGWAIWDGASAAALCVCLFSDNIDAGTARSDDLVPFIGLEDPTLIWRLDTGNDDNGTAYDASIITKPYTPIGMLHQFEIKSASILTKAVTDATMNVSIIRDFGLETKTVEDISCTPEADETQKILPLRDLSFAELRMAQVAITDGDIVGGRWEVNEFSMRQVVGQRV